MPRSQRQSSRADQQEDQRAGAISRTPGTRSRPNSSFSAIAPPTSSARSVITIASSADSHSSSTTRGEIGLRAMLGEALAGGDRQAHAERLHDHGDQVGDQHHRQQRVAEARAAAEIGRPIAGVDIADRDQQAGPGGADERAASRETRAGGKRKGAGDRRRASAMSKRPRLVCSNVVMAIRLAGTGIARATRA